MKTMQPQRVFGIGSLLLAVLFGALALYDFQTRQAAPLRSYRSRRPAISASSMPRGESRRR